MLRTSFAAARDIHGEWKLRVRALLDLLEGTQKGVTGLARQLSNHTDRVVEEALNGAEEVLGTFVRSAEDTASVAAESAARTAGAWVGRSERAA